MMQPALLEHVRKVLLDGVDADVQSSGDLLVGQASAHERQNLDFPRGQTGRVKVRRRLVV